MPAASTADTDALLIDIGGDRGALVVYAPAHLDGREVEVVPVGRPAPHHPPHNVVRPRRVAGAVVHAAVFPDLPPGDYLPHGGWTSPEGRLTVTAGRVVETEWRRARPSREGDGRVG
jgi:hypothetical protein